MDFDGAFPILVRLELKPKFSRSLGNVELSNWSGEKYKDDYLALETTHLCLRL